MKALIIEDETAAALNLKAILKQAAPDIRVVDTLESVEESVDWLRANPQPDLLFMDIHLADGDSFRIFDAVEVTAPVIFTTAYDRYALEAFKVNSIDYLLKPLNAADVQRALDKLMRLSKGERSDFLVQKCTEAGAAEVVFFSCTRCVAKAANIEKKVERWQRIAEEAAKQSGRGIIPQVRYTADYVSVLNDALHTDLPLFMYETGERETIRDAIEHAAQPVASAAIITGPEGGFAEFEADMARKLGMHICSMGERILRCETAPVVALTALMYGTGNL